jgi:hypothetical protein
MVAASAILITTRGEGTTALDLANSIIMSTGNAKDLTSPRGQSQISRSRARWLKR